MTTDAEAAARRILAVDYGMVDEDEARKVATTLLGAVEREKRLREALELARIDLACIGDYAGASAGVQDVARKCIREIVAALSSDQTELCQDEKPP